VLRQLEPVASSTSSPRIHRQSEPVGGSGRATTGHRGIALSAIIPALNEGASVGALVRKVGNQLRALGLTFEIVVVDGGSTDGTPTRAAEAGATVVRQEGRGYADALLTGFRLARGRYVVTLDADYSHDPDFLGVLWAARARAEVVIASRYVPGGHAQMSRLRRLLSRVTNAVSRGLLSLPVRDMTSGFRLYHRKVLRPLSTQATHFDVLVELLTRIAAEGWKVAEVPFHYRPRRDGRSHVSLLRFGLAYARTLARMWAVRNSLDSADYDDRAFSSRIPIQRSWQRRRYGIVLGMLGHPERVLDAGCGSSKILEALPRAVGLDLAFKPLRFRSRTNRWLVNGSVQALPFGDGAFDAVICSEVVEHLPYDPRIFAELERVLSRDGVLIIGTPDYGRWQWRWIEWWYNRLLPRGHGPSHVERYTEASLRARLAEVGFEVVEAASICRAELILKCRKSDGATTAPAAPVKNAGAATAAVPATSWRLAALLVGALALRLAFFGGLLGWDDVEYLEAARGEGAAAPGSMFGLRHGLLIPLGFSLAWFGENEYAAALVPLAYSLAGLLLAYVLGVSYGGPRVGFTAAGLLAILPLDVIAATELHADLPIATLMAAAVYAAVRGELGGRWHRLWFVAAGLALGAAALTKEVALALAAVLALRLLWLRRGWAGYGWLAVGCLAVVAAEMAWLWWLTGSPLYRFADAITAQHVARMRLLPPSSEWPLAYPGMLLNPLDGSFGYFAGLFSLVLAGTLWGLRRGEPAVRELLLWWCPLLVAFNFAPLDWSLSRPLFVHFARTLHPLLIPFALTVAVWWINGLGHRTRLRTATMAGVALLAAVGIWTTHADYRGWASVARQAATAIDRKPADAVIATDPFNAGVLRILLPHRREQVFAFSETPRVPPQTPMLLLHDPVFIESAVQHGHGGAPDPLPHWERLAEFTRPRRPSLRAMTLQSLGVGNEPSEPLPAEPAVLWRIPPPQGRTS
jgi:dolichol-phosphate mannosyltransferase